jgi:hypothetical protein
MNYFLELASNHDPPDFCLLSGWDYTYEPQCLALSPNLIAIESSFLNLVISASDQLPGYSLCIKVLTLSPSLAGTGPRQQVLDSSDA